MVPFEGPATLASHIYVVVLVVVVVVVLAVASGGTVLRSFNCLDRSQETSNTGAFGLNLVIFLLHFKSIFVNFN